MLTNSVSAESPSIPYPEYESGTQKDKFQYLFLDLSKGFLSSLLSTHCDCASIAAKIFIFTLPMFFFFEAIVDLLALPFIWAANQLCRESPIPVLMIPTLPVLSTTLSPSAAPPSPNAAPEVLAPPPTLPTNVESAAPIDIPQPIASPAASPLPLFPVAKLTSETPPLSVDAPDEPKGKDHFLYQIPSFIKNAPWNFFGKIRKYVNSSS